MISYGILLDRAMLIVCAFILLVEIGEATTQNDGIPSTKDSKPNIIIILADDMVILIVFRFNFVISSVNLL